MSIRTRAYEEVVGRLPATLAGQIDLLRPSFRASWGGPLNGQERRRDVVRALARTLRFDVVIETGTYRGTSTEFFSAVFGVPVETVEGSPRFFAYSKHRLAFDPTVHVALGDSRPFLRELAQRRNAETPFVYLDAHWEEDLPLREELEIIRDSWKSAAVMIDDFAVPGDPGYRYDDYGAGKALVEDYLPEMPGWALLYPAAGSDQETGAKRGSCVLLAPPLAETAVEGLRRARIL